MTKFFINFKEKNYFWTISPFSPFWGQIFFQKIWLYDADSHMGPKHNLKFQKNWANSKKTTGRTEGWTDPDWMGFQKYIRSENQIWNWQTSLENHPLLNMYWMPKMHENPIKAILISAFSKSSIKSLARTITSIFRLVFRKIQAYNDKCRFSTDDSTFWVVQNKPVTIQ